MDYDAEAARAVAERLLLPLARRLAHVRGVAAKASRVTGALRMSDADAEAVVAAAWLHDIGYAPDIAVDGFGFHPIDGAAWLTEAGWPRLVVGLVAHHSGAAFESAERGITMPFERPDERLLDTLTYCDLTIGPDGEDIRYEERMADILRRYAPNHPVRRTWVAAAPVVGESVDRIREALGR